MSAGLLASIWPHLVALAMLAALAWGVWRRGNVPGGRALLAACFFEMLWLAGAIGGALAAQLPAQIAWYTFESVWRLPTVTATTCFALEYTYPGRWLTRRNLVLLSIPPLLVMLLVLTDGLHHWYWTALSAAGSLQPQPGAPNWMANVYGVGLVLVNMAAFTWLFIRSPQHRWPVAVMVVGQLAGRVLYAADLAAGPGTIQPSPVVLSLAVAVVTYAIAVFGFRILDPLPAARSTAVEQMQDGMVVFDPGWRALSLNPAAERILGAPAARARGKTWPELLPDCPDPGRLLESGAPPLEISRPGGARAGPAMDAGARHYALALSRLQDHRGLTTGHLLLLRDVTEERLAQARQLEQQWAQATLQERELLAQELHDGIAQTLGFLNLQAQAARLMLDSGLDQAARDSLDRLTEVAVGMQGEARELIGDLLAVSLPAEGLCGAVRRAAARFEEQTDLPIRLELGEDADAVCGSGALPPAAGVQLLRILQEALANIRRHAGAPGQIGVQLRADDGRLRMAIVDDGAGFDPDRAGSGGKHFGLQVMRQRAERIAGQLTVQSAPGQGTRVEVSVPLGSDALPGRAT